MWSRFRPGDQHSLALKADGTLWAWGDNALRSTRRRHHDMIAQSPVQVFAPAGYSFDLIAGGAYSTVVTFQAVPEPASILGFGALALGAVGAWRKRRARSAE